MQTDRSFLDCQGNEVREVITKVKAVTFFESRSALAQFTAMQTDKSQRASVGSITQEGTSTNLVRIVEAAVEGAVKRALKP